MKLIRELYTKSPYNGHALILSGLRPWLFKNYHEELGGGINPYKSISEMYEDEDEDFIQDFCHILDTYADSYDLIVNHYECDLGFEALIEMTDYVYAQFDKARCARQRVKIDKMKILPEDITINIIQEYLIDELAIVE